MEPKFKIGDRVKVLPIADDSDSNYTGEEALEAEYAESIHKIRYHRIEFDQVV